MRRLSTVVAAAALLVGGVLAAVAPSAQGAAADHLTAAASPSVPSVAIVKVSGLLDPVLSDFLTRSVHQAEAEGSIGMVLQVNSPGSVISDDELVGLAETLHTASIPIIAWVGPSGAKAEGGAAQLLARGHEGGRGAGFEDRQHGRRGRAAEVVVTGVPCPARQAHSGTLGSEAGGVDRRLRQVKDALVLRRVLLQVPGFRVKAAGRHAGHPARVQPVADRLGGHAHRREPGGRLPAVRRRDGAASSSSCSPRGSASPAWSAPAASSSGPTACGCCRCARSRSPS